MKLRIKRGLLGAAATTLVVALAACAGNGGASSETQDGPAETATNEKLRVVTSFSILTDMAEQIGGDRVEVHNLVPLGTDPHRYDPLPEDLKAASDADLLIYNGLNLEGGKDGWFFRLIEVTESSETPTVEASKGVEPEYLTDEAGNKETNPHAFLSPRVGAIMAENLLDGFVLADPQNEDFYTERANEYIAEIAALDEEYGERIAEIPEQQRVLVTSERAYQYMASDYGLREGYIWAVDTDENGSPNQIKALVDFVRDNDVPGLFVESNVDTRPMEAVASETGVEIVGEIYSDEIGKPGSEGDTYLKYLRYNLEKITAGLAG